MNSGVRYACGDEERPGEPAHGARDHERSEPIRVGKAERARSRLVRLGGSENEAEPGVDEPVPDGESEDKDREHQVVEGVASLRSTSPQTGSSPRAHALVIGRFPIEMRTHLVTSERLDNT